MGNWKPGTLLTAAQLQEMILALGSATTPGQHLIEVCERLADPDPAVRARAVTDELRQEQAYIEFLSKYRDDAIRERRARGTSYDRLAELLETTKGRAGQIVRRLEATRGQD